MAELASSWEGAVRVRASRPAGRPSPPGGEGQPKDELVFVDRLLVTLVHVRTGLTHAALGVIYQTGSSTIGRATGEIRPPLTERGFAIPERPGLRLRTLEDVFAYAQAENVALRIDGVETQAAGTQHARLPQPREPAPASIPLRPAEPDGSSTPTKSKTP
ncbi:transposase family protein [Streptomyces sp. NPDC002285]